VQKWLQFDLSHGQLPGEATLVKGDQDAQTGRMLGPSDAGTAPALLPFILSTDPLKLKLGDHITLSNPTSGTRATLTVVGFYMTNGLNPLFGQILTDQAMVQNLAGNNLEFDYSLQLDPASTNAILGQIRMLAPSVHTTSLADLLDTYKPLISNAIGLLDLIAAMALIASLVTLANTVALEMLQRRRELGILKSIGHSSRSVFSEVLLENGLIGLTGGLLGMVLVLVLAPMLNSSLFSSLANFDMLVAVPWAIGITLVAIAICLLVAAGVSWSSTRVRPLEVLRYE